MFRTTRWSLVAAASDAPGTLRSAALADLCQLYWYPVYFYVRRRTPDRHKAEDLTQAFFARLLEKNDLAAADPTRGRFRTFLLTACQHFLANQHDHDSAIKRGGRLNPLPIDFGHGDEQYTHGPSDTTTPDSEFERRWAVALLDQTLKELRVEYATAGKESHFDVLKGTLTGDVVAYRDLGRQLGLSEGAVKVAVHRLRQRYRDRQRAAIAETVDRPADVDDEIRDLFEAFG
ncbi:MAG: sigma-70 family RNA polymerase sigma factor [Fimbriiglobus sp.]|nr:sigma-70 family RNA polymerase sigma factor [Fimbriiglobus sp.]